jgi:AhpD family alkylhydroperoxidase
VELAIESAGLVDDSDNLEPPESGHVPNYLRALAARPGAPKAFAHLAKQVLYAGTLEPELKMGMALRMAQMDSSPYAAAHLERLLGSSARGQVILGAIRSGDWASLQPEERLGLNFADWLSPDVNGISDANFRIVRGYFTDSEIVELTFTVCFFSYFDRWVEALGLPVESWVLDSPSQLKDPPYERPWARVPVVSDDMMAMISADNPVLQDMRGRTSGSLGLHIANSERAMLWRPEIAYAWWAYGKASRASITLPREMMLQVSFAVSTANGCRYCILHQVLGLRRIGVDPAKLVSMKKDDSSLTPRELTAVLFARQLTHAPASITDDGYQKLRAEFGDPGALDIVLQTCNFAFMNHFTDGLTMPSEDIAVQTYREVYGIEWKK